MRKLMLAMLPALLLFFFCVPGSFAEPPSGFVKSKLADDLNLPTDFVQTPDGRMLITEQGGIVKVLKNGAVLPQPFLTIPVNNDGERGLLGITLDLDFPTNQYLYVYYVNNTPLEIRVSRFTASGDQAVSGSEQILLRSTQPLGLVHHGGTVRFGLDGKLWISVGNNNGLGVTSNSQDLSNIHGKILRINKDGSVPADNPFVNQQGAHPAIWAYGLRNPFRFNFLPGGKPAIGDVGDASWEEIDVGVKGGNFGYPFCEGPCPNGQPYINPSYYYPHPTSGNTSASVTGGFVYSGNQFPEKYRNAYFFGDYGQRFIKVASVDSGGNFGSVQTFDNTAGSVVELQQGQDGSLYYIQIYGNGYPSPGILWKVSYSPGNLAPVAKASADPTTGILPLTVQFSSAGSSDPEGQPLSYSWNFGDGASSTSPNPTRQYTASGVYNAVLTVSDGSKSTQSDPIQIAAGQNYPTASIVTPAAGTKYNASQTISYSGSANDQEDGMLPQSAYSWTIIFHHNEHIHPFLGPINGVSSGTFTIPDAGETSANTWYEIILTVTDSSGLQKTVSRTIFPNTVNLTFASNPSGLSETLDGIPITTPHTVDGVVGFKRALGTTSPQSRSGDGYQFVSWSDGGNQNHVIVTPQSSTTYTAQFRSTGQGVGKLHFRIQEFDESGNFTRTFLNGITVKLTDTSGDTVFASTTSQTQGNEAGWVFFDNMTPGTYGIMGYKTGYAGFWKQVDCNTENGSTQNATIQNANTDGLTAAWDNNASITSGGVTYCQDLGLKQIRRGNLYFRVLQIDKNAPGVNTPYSIVGYVNDATVKLTDTSGNTVIRTTNSIRTNDGQDGWVFLNDVRAGTYGVMAYKNGHSGYLKQVDCNGRQIVDSTINNQHTQSFTAAWNNSVPVAAGTTTYCYDLGLTQNPGNIRFRIQEFQADGSRARFLNGATAKLTTPDGLNVVSIATSSAKNNEEGWVHFDNVNPGTYAVMAYKAGMAGFWKEVDCTPGHETTQNATIQNQHTDGLVAAWDNNVPAVSGQTTYCHDLGLKDSTIANKGSLRFRIQKFNTDGSRAAFLNDVTVKLTDSSGTTSLTTQTSLTSPTGEDGWVYFDNMTPGTYGVMAYKNGLSGYWKQVDCIPGHDTTQNATIQNALSENEIAAWDNNAPVVANQTTYCHDLGLKDAQSTTGNIRFRIQEFGTNGSRTGFLNDVTAKLTDTSGNTVISSSTSFTKNKEEGWIHFDNLPEGTYGIMAYKQGYKGYWKQVSCNPGDATTQNATTENQHTEGLVAAWDNNTPVAAGQTTYCHDLGIMPEISSNPQPITPTLTPTPTNNITPTP